ncbi:hypothetical protein BKA93DRAFT_494145 [Sparassis latifolia]
MTEVENRKHRQFLTGGWPPKSVQAEDYRSQPSHYSDTCPNRPACERCDPRSVQHVTHPLWCNALKARRRAAPHLDRIVRERRVEPFHALHGRPVHVYRRLDVLRGTTRLWCIRLPARHMVVKRLILGERHVRRTACKVAVHLVVQLGALSTAAHRLERGLSVWLGRRE